MNDTLPMVLERFQQIAQGFVRLLPNLLLAIVVFGVFVLLAGWIRRLVSRMVKRRDRHNLALVMGRLTQWVVLLVGLLVALSILIPSFRAGDLVQLLGIGSVAIGFAFRDIFQNFLAGILLLLTEPFKLGDQIVVGQYEGTVEDIQTRATTIRTYDGRRVVIPNADLFTQSVIVNTAFENRRLEYDIGIGYGDDISTARELILQAIKETPGVLSDPPPDALVMELAESSVSIRARWWIAPPRRADALDARDRVLEAIKIKLQKNGIDLPFPTQQILFHDQTESTDGNRKLQREGWPAGKDEVPEPAGLARTLERTRPKQDNP